MTLDELIQQVIELKENDVPGDTIVVDYNGHELTDIIYDNFDNAVILE